MLNKFTDFFKIKIIAFILAFKSTIYLNNIYRELYNETYKGIGSHGFQFENLGKHFLDFVDGIMFRSPSAKVVNSNGLNSIDITYRNENFQFKSYIDPSDNMIDNWRTRYTDQNVIISDGSKQKIGDIEFRTPRTDDIKNDNFSKMYMDSMLDNFYIVVCISIGVELGNVIYNVVIEKKKLKDLINLENSLKFLVKTGFLFIAMLLGPVTLVVLGIYILYNIFTSRNPIRKFIINIFFFTLYMICFLIASLLVNITFGVTFPVWICVILINLIASFAIKYINESFIDIYKFCKKGIRNLQKIKNPIEFLFKMKVYFK